MPPFTVSTCLTSTVLRGPCKREERSAEVDADDGTLDHLCIPFHPNASQRRVGSIVPKHDLTVFKAHRWHLDNPTRTVARRSRDAGKNCPKNAARRNLGFEKCTSMWMLVQAGTRHAHTSACTNISIYRYCNSGRSPRRGSNSGLISPPPGRHFVGRDEYCNRRTMT